MVDSGRTLSADLPEALWDKMSHLQPSLTGNYQSKTAANVTFYVSVSTL